jgi:2-succinyl-5-enolpyruvyl-6-hydroxy-3-cyclohexene-1-carboxylate synthase
MTATDTHRDHGPAIAIYSLLRAFCDELARCGMRDACTSPGSRCTPLVLSLVREPRIRSWSHLDERCSGFFALGAAKRSGLPVAVTCTSGTAAANLAPAVIEAHHARVPLIVLTADRPPELREVGAGQTIDQLKLYGDAVKWFFEVGIHDSGPASLRWIRTLACRAYWTAVAGPPGPVHLNFPLREPLVLGAELPPDVSGREGERPYVMFEAPAPAPLPGPGVAPGPAVALEPPARVAQAPSGRIVIVAGQDRDPAGGERIARLAAESGIPVLADPLSGARRGPTAIAHYDLLLRDPGFAGAHQPQFVIRTGDLPTSKPLRAWLAGLQTAQIAFDPDGTWHDPDSVVGLRIQAPLTGHGIDADPEWLASWRAADHAVADAIEATLGSDELSEPLVARSLGSWLPPDATLFVASSMPIRDVEEFISAPATATGAPPRVLSNRGANGIDGTVSSAFGAAAAGAGPVVLLIGDVALAHDIGGLLAARRLGLALTIVLLNNDGGGIFHFLPVAGETDAFEEHVATPHGLEFAQAAALYGCGHVSVRTPGELREAVEGSIAGAGATIIEVRTDREENLALHRRVAEAALTALNDATASTDATA